MGPSMSLVTFLLSGQYSEETVDHLIAGMSCNSPRRALQIKLYILRVPGQGLSPGRLARAIEGMHTQPYVVIFFCNFPGIICPWECKLLNKTQQLNVSSQYQNN